MFTIAGRYVYEDRWGGELDWQRKYRGTDVKYGESIYTNRWETFGTYQLPTSENINFYGDSRAVALPNSKINAYLSYIWWQDLPALENADWIAPSIPVTMSFDEYANNQDPVLEAALTFNVPDFKPKPMDYIVSLYLSGETQKLAEELPKMIQDPLYAFCDFEMELIKIGNILMQSGRAPQIQASIQVFSMVLELFPNSANAYKYLGEAYTVLQDTHKAREVLQKAISLDPNGEIGIVAKKLLSEIVH